jgi:4,5-DOPA dioxygenase extradiol
MPVLFVGHGNPMNAIEENRWSHAFRDLAASLPTPRAVLAISAHWYGPGTQITGSLKPSTIHDFGGFPQELFAVEYPAPGDPALAQQICTSLQKYGANVTQSWGLDHGTWTVMRHLKPAADIPVLQLSIDYRLNPSDMLKLGGVLRDLRDQGVLILGSGNLTHNLSDAMARWGQNTPQTPDWALRFDADIAQALLQHDMAYLATAMGGTDYRKAHPTPDHYLPLLYAAGAADGDDPVRFPIEGFDVGSLSMRAALFG